MTTILLILISLLTFTIWFTYNQSKKCTHVVVKNTLKSNKVKKYLICSKDSHLLNNKHYEVIFIGTEFSCVKYLEMLENK